MGLLMSETLLIDPMLNDTLHLRDRLGEWAYAPDLPSDPYQHEATDTIE